MQAADAEPQGHKGVYKEKNVGFCRRFILLSSTSAQRLRYINLHLWENVVWKAGKLWFVV